MPKKMVTFGGPAKTKAQQERMRKFWETESKAMLANPERLQAALRSLWTLLRPEPEPLTGSSPKKRRAKKRGP